ncbi:16S rRNA (uracil(1498)-N(3))-methyltransferase [Halovulum sp. GXIMD14793]
MKIRLFVQASLCPGAEVTLTTQAHYLANVLRCQPGDRAYLFNGQDGEWQAEITDLSKRQAILRCQTQTAPQRMPPDLWLCFAPIKKARTDFIVEKAAELGAARIQPVITQLTNSERVRTDRLQAHAVEAAEQCGGTFVPTVAEPVRLDSLLSDWPGDRRLMFCDESLTAHPAQVALSEQDAGPWAILIGPEGGFSPDEAARLRQMPQTLPVTLGPRILRADTAAVTALSLWQAALGDW